MFDQIRLPAEEALELVDDQLRSKYDAGAAFNPFSASITSSVQYVVLLAAECDCTVWQEATSQKNIKCIGPIYNILVQQPFFLYCVQS